MEGARMAKLSSLETTSMGTEPGNGTCHVLIVEGRIFLANDLERALRLEGAEIVGPISELSEAIRRVEKDGFHAAIIDINLHGQSAHPVTDKLAEEHIPFVFARGYNREILPSRFSEVARFEKPYDVSAIAKHVVQLGRQANGRST
jgi:DNA-binding NtrC family response regulator